MTAANNINLLMYAFTLITLLGIAALGWRALRAAPTLLLARRDREIAERSTAMTALAAAHAQTPDGPTRDSLARNYRYHRATVRTLDPAFVAPDLGAPETSRRVA